MRMSLPFRVGLVQRLYSMTSSITSNKTLVLTGFGGFDKLKVEHQPVPEPGQGEVLLKVMASGINFAELMARQGLYDPSLKTPCVLGFEGAGQIIKVGPDTESKVGDDVICVIPKGLWREYAVVPQSNIFPIPKGLTYAQAAAIPINYVTAFHMLFDIANLRPNRSVLIHMVAGGVGNAAVQLCRSVPNVTMFGTCSAAKHDVMKKAGVHHLIDYKTQDYEIEIRKISPKGVDIVLDPLSGKDSKKGYNLLKPMGTIVHFGAANMVTGEKRDLMKAAWTYLCTSSYSPLDMMNKNRCVAGYHMGKLINDQERVREAFQALTVLHGDGFVNPVVDSIWPLEDADKAMARMVERKNIGKVVFCPQKEAGQGEILSIIK